jgi:hypothetical protein
MGSRPGWSRLSAAHRQEALHRVRDTKAHDGSPFKVRELIPHDSRLRFGRLNHVQTDVFNRQNRQPAFFEIAPWELREAGSNCYKGKTETETAQNW